MEVQPETLDALAGWFAQTLSPDAATRGAAEQSLSAAAASPGFPFALLALASSPRHDGADAVDGQRTSGYSVSFVRLQYAGKSNDGLLKEVNDP